MRSRYLVTGLVLAFVVVTAVLIYQARQTGTAANGGPLVATAITGVPVDDGSVAASSSTAAPGGFDPTSAAPPPPEGSGRPASNVPMTRLAPGEKAPQFIIFSFDGGGSHERWSDFMAAAAPTNSRFTGFLTGIYLLGDPAKDAAVYTGPGHAPGKASIGYGGPEAEIVTEVKDVNLAYSKGHEIGTHYNGHFCDDNPPGGNQWSTADWNTELDQFFTVMTGWKTFNGYTDAPDLTVPLDSIKGGRTPCLTGSLEAMTPAWKSHNLIYDSSVPAPYTGIAWPELKDGIWEFWMPTVYSPGFDGMTMAMDYNFWFKFNQGKEEPDTAPQVRDIVRKTYDYMYDQTYNGNRAPILIANHFNKWNGDSFNPPAMDFMRDKCGQPDTYCATYQDVIAWMQLQDPGVLDQLLAQPPVAGTAP